MRPTVGRAYSYASFAESLTHSMNSRDVRVEDVGSPIDPGRGAGGIVDHHQGLVAVPMRGWFTTDTLVLGKKKREHYLTWFFDTPVEGAEGVVASDMPWMFDQLELGIRVARMMARGDT